MVLLHCARRRFARRVILGVLVAGASLSLAEAQPPVLYPDHKLTPADAAPWDQFGLSPVLDGDLAVVGALSNSEAGSGAGAVHVYRFLGTTWVQEAKLLPHDPGAYDAFGVALDVDGDVIVVAAQNDDAAGQLSGSVYVFRRDGTGWTEEAKLIAPDPGYLKNFGTSVALEGDTLAIGSHRDSAGAWLSGSVWIFRHDGGAWVPEQKLTPLVPVPGGNFGQSLSLKGDVLAVGAPRNNGGAPGRAHVFRRAGGTWSEEAVVGPWPGSSRDFFGWTVSTTGEVLVVGRPWDDEAGSKAGAAFVYRHWDGDWILEQKLVPSGVTAGSLAGISVVLSGNRAGVGITEVLGGGRGRASAYLFTPLGWIEEWDARSDDGGVGDGLGYGVHLLGDTLLATAPGNDELGEAAGAAYVFELPPPPGPDEYLEDLIDLVYSLDLPKGAESSLVQKLEAALALLADDNPDNDQAALALLQAFINHVSALTPNLIDEDTAETLILGALAVIAAIEEASG